MISIIKLQIVSAFSCTDTPPGLNASPVEEIKA